MPLYSIRKVYFEELDLCVDVIRKSFITVANEFGLTAQNCPTNGAFIQTERLISDWNQNINLYGLFYDKELVGCMELKKKRTEIYELGKLSVLPEHRHKGCGTILLDFAREEVSRMGGNRIAIGIIESNDRLKRWYLKHNFISTGMANFSHIPFVVGFMEAQIETTSGIDVNDLQNV